MAGRSLLCLALMPAFLHGGAVPRPALGAALRCRGGRDGEHPAPAFSSSVRSAARKLCASPPLLAAKPAEAKSAMPASLQRHMRGIVFGGMDGILTTFALLAAVAGSGGTSPALTLVIGISTVLADGFSMGAGEYISAKAEAEVEGGTNDEETTPLEKGVAVSRRPPATSHHSCVRLLPPPSLLSRARSRVVCGVAWADVRRLHGLRRHAPLWLPADGAAGEVTLPCQGRVRVHARTGLGLPADGAAGEAS